MEHYKKLNKKRKNLEEAKMIRAIEGLERRRKRRSDLFTSNRGLNDFSASSEVPTRLDKNEQQQKQQQQQQNQDNREAVQNVREDRASKLAKWKAERELKKKLNQWKKPVFRAGVYTHRLDSPIFLHQLKTTVKPTNSPRTVPRITRATAKRLAAKSSVANTPSVNAGVSKGKKTAATLARGVKNSTKNTLPEHSFAPDNHQFKAPIGLLALPLFGQEALQSTSRDAAGAGTGAGAEAPPVYFSPYVVKARGKRASRIEQLEVLHISNGSIDEGEEAEASKLEIEEENISEEELTPMYFKIITNKEVNRLEIRCSEWMVVKSAPDLSEEAGLIINQAIGQTNLLINKKIEQFRKLINDCEFGLGDKLVTCEDLQGFWDMIYMQIRDCDSRFDKLSKLQEKNWVEEEEKKVPKPMRQRKQPPVTTAKNVTSKSSSVREMILTARRKKMESQAKENSPVVVITESNKPHSEAETSRVSSIKFDGGFFVVESPQKSAATPRSAKMRSLMPQTPENLGSSKLRRSALSAMKISQILKPLEIEASEVKSECEISYVNCGQTPGKSILKKLDIPCSTSRSVKSQNKVNFWENRETTMIVCDDKVSKFDIESSDKSNDYDKKCEENLSGDLHVKKRLEFLNLSSSDSDQEEQHASCSQETACGTQIPAVDDSGPAEKAIATNRTNGKRVTRQTSKSVLNKVDQFGLSSTSNIQSTEPEARQHITNSSVAKNDEHKENEIPKNTEIIERRRSTRKSVKFIGEECTACMDTKPVLPMTPSAKRRTSKHSEKVKPKTESKRTTTSPTQSSSEDLISWETPLQLPPRVRRSLRIKGAQL